MDKKKGILNIGTSIISKIILMLVALYLCRLLILYIGNEANGLNFLYASIIGLLSVFDRGFRQDARVLLIQAEQWVNMMYNKIKKNKEEYNGKLRLSV